MENRLLFGTAYYPEYMPYERTDQDIAMMKAAGMNTVRIAESTWSTLEPAEGIFDLLNPTFRKHAEIVIRKLAAHTAGHKNVTGFQIDNETKHYDNMGRRMQAGFRQYLKEKFVTTERLNEAFGLAYWSNSNLVLECQAQAFKYWTPYPGQLRLHAYSHLASGAGGCCTGTGIPYTADTRRTGRGF